MQAIEAGASNETERGCLVACTQNQIYIIKFTVAIACRNQLLLNAAPLIEIFITYVYSDKILKGKINLSATQDYIFDEFIERGFRIH